MKKIFFSYVIFLNGLLAFCQNPQLLKDVSPGNNSGTIANIVKTSNYTFFNENDGGATTDRSLYRTDGTPGGTIKLNLTYLPDPPPSPNNYISTKAEKLTALGNKVIFSGDNAAYYGEIWSSDGTQAGTIAIERFQPTINNRAPVYELAEMNGYVYYGVTATNNKTQIRRTDGTLGGTSLVYEFSSYTTAPETGLFKVINGILYFNLYDRAGTGIDQLWRSDGTAAGTYLLKDFGLDQFVASWYMPANSGLFYWMIVKPGTGNVLWKSDGTIAGTGSVKTIGTTGNNNYPQFAATIGDNIAFAGLDGNGRELWTTDGTAAGTNMVADINPGAVNSNPSGLIFWNGLLYFSAFKADSGTELWKSDGSSSGTILVKDINPGTANSSPSSLVLSNNTILFRATTATTGAELWLTDGTAANTAIVADMNPGAGDAFPNLLTTGNPVFFAANNGTSGFEVFKYDNSEGVLGAKKVWLTGLAFGEWKESGVIKMTNNGGGIYTATNIQIIGDGRFKFTEGTWASAAGYSALPGFPTGVTAVPGLDDITGALGFWNVKYNYITKAYSFTPTPPDNWGVVGTATPNGWNGPDLPLSYDAISNKWSAVVSLADGEIKFRNNNDWAVNYGDNGADGSLDTNGANIAITGGRYLITLDFNTLKYTITIKSALVAIPDPNFEQALINLGIDKDGVINASISRIDAEAVTELNVNSKNISSLTGIEAFTNLSKLYCQYNQIQVLDISNNATLTILECGGNQLNQLNVTKNPLLKTLGFGPNNISQIDVSQNLNLEVFWCNNNNITSQNLDLNSKLTVIGLSNNPLAFVSLKNGNNVNVVYFEASNTPNLACINADAIVSVSMSNSGKTFSENCSTTSLAGSWIIAPETRALKVGPTPGSDLWWYLNKFGDDITARACYLDDKYVFNENGSFNNVLGSETFLEIWQSGDTERCGSPVAPHNGPNATYVYNQNAGTITLNGQGAYLGLPKVANGYELPNGPVPNSITYNVSFSDNGNIMTLSINFGAGYWTYKFIKESAPKTYYVNDNSKTGDVFTSAIGNNFNIGTKAAPFATLTYAISKAQNGDAIYVDAGTYAERIFVNKSLSIKGAQTGSNPGASLSRGLSESILIPSAENNLVEIMTIQASDVSIDGFLFDGDNPALSGSINLNGIDINAGMGIYNGNLATNNLIAQNNIFKNFFRYGIFLQRNVVSERLSGINISRNHIDNVSSKTPRDGRGVGFFNNVYGTVTDNYFTRVNTGVIIANYVNGSTDSILISSNNIEAYSYGINASSNSNITSPLIIDNNQFTVADLTTWSAPGSSSVNNYVGLGVFNLTSSKNVSINNNMVTGTQTGIYLSSIVSPLGIQVNGGSVSNSSQIGLFYINRGIGAAKLSLNNVSLINNVVGMDASAGDGNNLQLEFSGVTINGGTTGIRFYGLPISLPSNTLSGVSFLNQSKEYILQTVNAFQGQTIDASTVSFDGVTPINMTLAQLFATEDKLTHKIDIDNVGYFKLKPSEVFVTPNSFTADLPPSFGIPTFGPEINRAVGAASAGDVVHIKAGIYINQINIDKAITIKGEGKELTSILKPTETVAPPGTFTEQGVIQTGQNIVGDVHISDLSVTGDFTVNVTPIIIQSGGSVRNCSLQSGNQGIFVRIDPAINLATKTFVVDENIINAEYIGVNFAGANRLTATLTNNSIAVSNPYFSTCVFAGTDFGTLSGLTVTGNSFSTFVTDGLFVNTNNGTISQNSFTGSGQKAINKFGGSTINASCNWYGSANAATVSLKINGSVNYSPWLTNGLDSDLASNGFQPLADVCNGTPVAVILNNSTNSTCNGADNGMINITVSNGLVPYNYLWTNSDNPEFSSSNEDLTNLEPGTYQLLLTDTNGSTASLSNIVISEPSLLTATADGINNLCFGESTGTAFVVADGGTTPYTYLWNNGATTDEISNLSAGTYSVTVTDANGCTKIASYEVTQPTLLTASITNNSTACSNKATVTALDGTPGYTFLWSNGAITASIDNVPVGSYTVTVTDANGCTTTASITLTVGEAFNPTASVTDVSCFGGSNGTITVTNANGTAPFTFSKDGITFLSGTFPYSFNNLSAGTYNIAVKDANGCTGFVTKTIGQPALLTATIITVQSTCSGQSTGAISVATAGGSGALKYSWTGIGNYTSTQKNISALAAGGYTLTVTDNNGCTTILNASVPTYNAIVVSDVVTNVLCRGSLTGAINLMVSGGSGSGFAYSWTGSTTSTSEDISNLGAGTNYNVTITDIGSGCITTKSYVITQPASNLSLTTGKTNATGCGGSLGTITATASGGTSPYVYKLDNGIYQSSGNFTLLSSGSYTVWVKDANGCTSSKVVAITDNGSDQYESNNSKSQAKLISIGTTINARIALATDTADWFKFTPTSTGNYKLTITHPTVIFTFNMYPSTNNAAALAPTSSDSTSKTYALTAGLTYFVQITGGLSFNCYNLSISTVASPAKYAVTNTKVITVDKLSVKAYPNPHQGLFNLSIISPEDGKAQIELFTILGQLLAKREVSIEKGQNTIVEFNDVGRGIILYHLTIDNQEVNGKVYGKD